MPYQVNCVKCGKALTLPDQALGRVVQCRHCMQSFLVPHPSGSMPAAPNPPPVIVAAPQSGPRAVAKGQTGSGRPHDFVQSFDAPEFLEDEGAPAGRGTPPVGNAKPEERGSSRRRSPSRGTPGAGSRGRGGTRVAEREGRDGREERGARGGKAAPKGNGTGVAMIVGAAVVAIGLIAFFAMQGKDGGGKGDKGKDGKGAKAEKPAPPPPPPPTKEELAWKAAQTGNHVEAAKLFDEASVELDAKGQSQRAIELSRESTRQRVMADEKGQK